MSLFTASARKVVLAIASASKQASCVQPFASVMANASDKVVVFWLTFSSNQVVLVLIHVSFNVLVLNMLMNRLDITLQCRIAFGWLTSPATNF